MSWLSDLVGPRLRDIVGSDRGEEESRVCGRCDVELSAEVFLTGEGRCPACGYVNALRPSERFRMIFDGGRYDVVDAPEEVADVLHFRDVRRYGDRLKEAQLHSQSRDALVVARGTAGGNDLVAACLDPEFLEGTIGIAAGSALARAARLAAIQRVPLVLFTGPGGARVQEGLLALAQSGRVQPALRELGKAGMPSIVVLGAGQGRPAMPPIHAFGDIVVLETPESSEGDGAVGEGEDGIAEEDESAVDLFIPRAHVRDAVVRLVDLAMNRRPSAPVLALHPSGSEAEPPAAVSRTDDARLVDHASDR